MHKNAYRVSHFYLVIIYEIYQIKFQLNYLNVAFSPNYCIFINIFQIWKISNWWFVWYKNEFFFSLWNSSPRKNSEASIHVLCSENRNISFPIYGVISVSNGSIPFM